MVGEEEEVDDEEMGVAETYADYMPSKCKYIFRLRPLSPIELSSFCLGVYFYITQLILIGLTCATC